MGVAADGIGDGLAQRAGAGILVVQHGDDGHQEPVSSGSIRRWRWGLIWVLGGCTALAART
jgi:hypothetical protein